MQSKLRSLNKFNAIMAVLHFAQGLAVLLLSKDFRLPLTVNFLTFDRATSTLKATSEQLATVPLAWLIVAFFFMSALAHLVIATVYRQRYEAGLAKGINKARWIEYSLSASTMMVAIAMLVGIYDLSSLIMIFGLVAIMNLCGLVMEVHNQSTKTTSWVSYWVGCLAGIVPWVAIALYFWSSNTFGSGNIPTFVYWIYVSIFIFFNSFAINMILQYAKVGKWKDYLYGERVYMVLSLVAKSLLAWQVFAGTLRP